MGQTRPIWLRASARTSTAAPPPCPPFGAASAVPLSRVAAADPSTPVSFLDAGVLFPKPLGRRNRLGQIRENIGQSRSKLVSKPAATS